MSINDEAMSSRFFLKVIEQSLLDIHFQPIICLDSGKVMGYEALARIQNHPDSETIKLFNFANKSDKTWEIERLCQELTFKKLAKLNLGNQKIFINISSHVLSDSRFKKVAMSALNKYKINPPNIVFEIKEKDAVEESFGLIESIEHYKRQGFGIALDNIGKGYSSISRIFSLNPSFIKADMGLIKEIDVNPLKASLIGSFVEFCSKNNITLIAAGVETEKELKVLKRIGVISVQGFYIGKAKSDVCDIDSSVKKKIKDIANRYKHIEDTLSFLGKIESICTPSYTVLETTQGADVFEIMKKNDNIHSVCVLNTYNEPIGMITYSSIMQIFGGRYGFDLNYKKKVTNIMQTNFLKIESETSIEDVAKMALGRDNKYLYDPVVVSKAHKYLGSVTVKELLEAAISIQVNMAADKNPLTGLYGNSVIEKSIRDKLNASAPFAAIYIDLDNFKAYNDAYGFYNGDKMIKTLAELISKLCHANELAGHIGGDDFIIITNDTDSAISLCERISETFSQSIRPLYSEDDWKNGWIVSKNRKDEEESFPIVSISISVVFKYECSTPCNFEDFSKIIADLKKSSKKTEGNSIMSAQLRC